MILGRVEVRDRDLSCVGLVVLVLACFGAWETPINTRENTRISTFRIPARTRLGSVCGFGSLSIPRTSALGSEFTRLHRLGYPRLASACAAFVW